MTDVETELFGRYPAVDISYPSYMETGLCPHCEREIEVRVAGAEPVPACPLCNWGLLRLMWGPTGGETHHGWAAVSPVMSNLTEGQSSAN